LAPGRPVCQDYEYERHGVANLFLAIETLCGRRRVRVTDRRTKHDLAEQLRRLTDEDYLDGEIIIGLVIDNYIIHRSKLTWWPLSSSS
jgi:hypothetical protein